VQIIESLRNLHNPRSFGGIGPTLASAGVILFCFVSPLSIAAAQIAGGICLLALIFGFATGGMRYKTNPLDLPLLLFVAINFLSLLTAVDRGRSLHSIRGDWILLFLPMFAQSIRGVRDVRRATTALLAGATIAAIYAGWQMFAGRDLMRHKALEPIGSFYLGTAFFGHHLTYGGNALMTSLLAFVLASQAIHARRRVLFARGGVALVQLGGIIASFARTAWIGFAAGILSTVLASRGAVRRIAVAAFVLAAGVGVAIPTIRERVFSIAGLADDPRVRLWGTAIRIWREHPILGAGHGSFGRLFESYKLPGTYMATGHPHNDILNILVQSGILGVLSFAIIWIRYFRFIARARRFSADDPRDPRGPLLLAGIVVPIGFLVGGLGQCYLIDEVVSMLICFFLAASIAMAREVLEDSNKNGPSMALHPPSTAAGRSR
jgi:O-antigen ligase